MTFKGRQQYQWYLYQTDYLTKITRVNVSKMDYTKSTQIETFIQTFML